MSSNLTIKILMVTTLLACGLDRAFAQQITNVVGTFNHGDAVTIIGNGFGERNHQQPYCWEDFEAALCAMDTLANTAGLYQGRLSHQEVYAGNQAIQLRHGDPAIDTDDSGQRQGWAYYRFPQEMQAGDEFFITFWSRWSWGCWWCDDPEHSAPGGPATTSYQIKNWRISSGNHYTTPPYIVHSSQSDCVDWPGPEFMPRFVTNRLNGNMDGSTVWYSHAFPDGSGGSEHTLPHEAWVQWEVMVRQSSPGGNDGANMVWIARNGRSAQVVDENNINTHAPGDPGFNKISIGDWIDAFGRSTTQYYDNFYFDMGWSRVVIGDAPDYDACSVRDVQPYTSWSDNTISITVNTSSFQDDDPAYLYFVGADGRPADVEGITIAGGANGGGGGDDGAPSAPSPVQMTQDQS